MCCHIVRTSRVARVARVALAFFSSNAGSTGSRQKVADDGQRRSDLEEHMGIRSQLSKLSQHQSVG